MSDLGQVLAKARLPEGVAGMTWLHEPIAQQSGEQAEADDILPATYLETGQGA